jgi:hypothetical protein
MKNALYGERNPPPCPVCNNTSRIITKKADMVIVSNYKRDNAKKGIKAGDPKWKIIKERSKKCTERHIHPGFGCTPYHHHSTKEITVGKEYLEKLILREEEDSLPGQLARFRLEFERRRKVMGFLMARRNPSGYYPFSLTVAGTDTLRYSSSSNCIGEGSNGQNIDKKYIEPLMRPDLGYLLFDRDYKAGESHMLAVYAQDSAYIEAHEGRYDPHTFVARLAWPKAGWTGDPVHDLKLANETKLYGKKLRDLSKTVQHAIGRYGSAHTIARTLKIKVIEAEEVLQAFKNAFPTLIAYLEEFKYNLRYTDELVCNPVDGIYWKFPLVGSPFGPNADDTARKMISALLQSGIWYITSVGFERAWYELDEHWLERGRAPFELLRHKHDSLNYQARIADALEYDKKVEEFMRVPLIIKGKKFVIKTSVEVRDENGEEVTWPPITNAA